MFSLKFIIKHYYRIQNNTFNTEIKNQNLIINLWKFCDVSMFYDVSYLEIFIFYNEFYCKTDAEFSLLLN